MLLNHMGEHFANHGKLHLASMYFKKGHEAMDRIEIIRKNDNSHERQGNDGRHRQAEETNGNQSGKKSAAE